MQTRPLVVTLREMTPRARGGGPSRRTAKRRDRALGVGHQHPLSAAGPTDPLLIARARSEVARNEKV